MFTFLKDIKFSYEWETDSLLDISCALERTIFL